MKLLGVGVMSWLGSERRSDRYGSVGLFTDPTGEKMPIKSDISGNGELIAVVKETRESHHIGDFFRGLFPSTPNVGDKIILGSGDLFFEDGCVGLKPDDGRSHDWLDPEQLYRAHDQTIELYFKQTS